MTKQQVIDKFLFGHFNVKSRNALSVRDGKLYSYNLCIAEHDGQGNIIVYDYMASGSRGMVSATTSQHVSLIKRSVPARQLILD